MAWFEWISGRALPVAWDLRRCGWEMASDGAEKIGPIARLVDASVGGVPPERLAPALRPRAIALGLADSTARALWLAMGYADAIPGDALLSELAQRAARMMMPPPSRGRLHNDRLSLDLVARDARVDGARLCLHPIEFKLMWRLAEAHGAAVSRRALLRDVFDLSFEPGTNRLAVHVCRLRKKLTAVGFGHLLKTAKAVSGYRLIAEVGEPGLGDEWGNEREDERGDPPRRFRPEPQFSLDQPQRLGEHARTDQELVP